MKVVLPDASELELPDGATGIEAARAIGPKLAEQAVLARVDGVDARPSPPALGGRAGPVPDDARHSGSRCALRAPPLDRPLARRGGHAPVSRRQDRDRPTDRGRLLLRLRVSRADLRGRSGRYRGGDAPRDRGGSRMDARGGHARRGCRPIRSGVPAVQGRAGAGCRRHDLALHAGRFHRPLPGPAPAGRLADTGAQADEPRRRVLARRREEHAAHADLRNRVLLAGRSRRTPRAARAGSGAGPPAPWS